MWAALFLAVFLTTLWVRANWGGVVFFTQDSFSLLNLAQDLAEGRLPALEQYYEGSPVNPWPIGYPAALAFLQLVTQLSFSQVALLLQVLLAGTISLICVRQGKWAWLAAICTDSGLWLAGHAWSEFLFISATLWVAALLAKRPQWVGLPALLALHTRQPGVLALLVGLLGYRLPKKAWTRLSLAFLTVPLYWVANAYYTSAVAGGPRVFEPKWLLHHWQLSTLHALLDELCLVRNTLNSWLIILQIGIVAWVFIKRKKLSKEGLFLVTTGVAYGVITITSHAFFVFAEDLDMRLLGPATVLIVAGLLEGQKFTKLIWCIIISFQLLLGLPVKALIINMPVPGKPTFLLNATPSWAPATPPYPQIT